jgi:serine/threonine-protein kinase
LFSAHKRLATRTILAMDTTLSRPNAGQLLDGRYRVGSWIARGGMATVYLGTDTKLDRTVALKIAHPELAGDPEFVRRFTGEARSAARLSSPNVVAVYDQGADGDLLYLVMEYVPGRTLRELLRERGKLGPREALDIFTGVLGGLAAAHRVGIIHRDVKPENVLLGERAVVKVADFGLARAAAGGGHTRTGMIIGTAAYLAPEQVSHSASDARTDVYASGVLLFEMLTGAQPHTGESPLAVAHKHVSDVVPPPSSLVPDLPPSLDALVALATSRDPDLRPADAGQFLSAVEDVRHGLPIGAPRPDRPPHALPAVPPPALPAAHGQHAALTGPMPAPDPASYAAELGNGTLAPAGSGFPWFPEDDRDGAGYGPGSRGHDGLNHTLIVPPGGGSYDAAPFDGGQYGNATTAIPYGGLPYNEDDAPDVDRRHMRGMRDYLRNEPLLQRWLFSRRFVYLALTVGVVVVIGVITWWVTAGQYSRVPAVRGMAAATAQAELQNLGFTVQVGPGRHSNLPKGDVVATDPAIGSKAKNGSTVTLLESIGPVMVGVPQVTGVPLSQAQAELRKAGLIPGTVTSAASSTIPAGIVISTSPVAGTAWPKPKPVGITVSAGLPLPNFVGQQFDQAQGTAQSGGYQLQQVADSNSDQPQGTITSQSPAAGTPITQGEVVTVHVSNGPPQVSIPDVSGLPVDQATQILQQAGFQVSVNQGLGGRVSSTSPSGQAPAGSTITLNVGFTFP